MKTIQSLLPANNTAKVYISVLINITHFLLESGQGKGAINMCTACCILLMDWKPHWLIAVDQGSAVFQSVRQFGNYSLFEFSISGNMSIWANFENANLPLILGQVKYNVCSLSS